MTEVERKQIIGEIDKLITDATERGSFNRFYFEVPFMMWFEKKINQFTRQALVKEFLYADLYPKAKAKHYLRWMRKGRCPGCFVGCGSKHREGCVARKHLLEQL